MHCNRFKGPYAGINSGTVEVVRLFHPRRDIWTNIFEQGELPPLTASACDRPMFFMNDPEVVNLRRALVEEGEVAELNRPKSPLLWSTNTSGAFR